MNPTQSVRYPDNASHKGYALRHLRDDTYQATSDASGYVIEFESQAGSGRNYSKVIRITDVVNNREYRAQRFHYRFIPIVCEFSYELLKHWRTVNGVETDYQIEQAKGASDHE